MASSPRRPSSPLLEKRRRARINESLNQLKMLILSLSARTRFPSAQPDAPSLPSLCPPRPYPLSL
uniref:BHLH domain-containing protein n=1 Tax=Meleagris gallopavo TaxID=9103 RepID=A0A803XWD0_MELGA